jgi:uncharacterized membrane protein (UPF0127 family)
LPPSEKADRGALQFSGGQTGRLLSALIWSAAAFACGSPEVEGTADAGVVVHVEQADSGQVLIEAHADLAITADERRQGLRGHAPLAPGDALLLILPRELEICIVNNDVSFAIDAIYARGNGNILAVERNIPADDGTARCHLDVRWVVEIAAGEARVVEPGDRLIIDSLPPLP